MTGDSGFPRRRSAGQGRPAQGFLAPAPKPAAATRGAGPEALNIARYVADMTAQLEAMAIAARLDLLAYFLGMAKAESELVVRTSAPNRDVEVKDGPAGGEIGEDSLDNNSFD